MFIDWLIDWTQWKLFSRNADTNHNTRKAIHTTTNNKRKQGDDIDNTFKETLMLAWIDHEIAKRCTKYETNLETRYNHFSQR
jgi:hypothetical protein